MKNHSGAFPQGRCFEWNEIDFVTSADGLIRFEYVPEAAGWLKRNSPRICLYFIATVLLGVSLFIPFPVCLFTIALCLLGVLGLSSKMFLIINLRERTIEKTMMLFGYCTGRYKTSFIDNGRFDVVEFAEQNGNFYYLVFTDGTTNHQLMYVYSKVRSVPFLKRLNEYVDLEVSKMQDGAEIKKGRS